MSPLNPLSDPCHCSGPRMLSSLAGRARVMMSRVYIMRVQRSCGIFWQTPALLSARLDAERVFSPSDAENNGVTA